MAYHFYELLSNLGANPYTEIKSLQFLFSEERVVPMGRYLETLETFIDEKIFRSLKLRGTFLSVSDMRKAIGISEYQLVGSFEKLFLFSEFLISIFAEGKSQIDLYSAAVKQVNIIMDNIETFVEKSNHKLIDIGEQKYIIVEKNKSASQAIEFIDNNAIAIEIIEYNHYKLKGNLQQKQNILNLLANYIEPILKNRAISSRYTELFSDVGFLLNCFHIRHNNKEGKKAQEYIQGLDDSTLEMWYDRTYNMILSVIIAEKNVEYSNKLSDLKKNYKWIT